MQRRFWGAIPSRPPDLAAGLTCLLTDRNESRDEPDSGLDRDAKHPPARNDRLPDETRRLRHHEIVNRNQGRERRKERAHRTEWPQELDGATNTANGTRGRRKRHVDSEVEGDDPAQHHGCYELREIEGRRTGHCELGRDKRPAHRTGHRLTAAAHNAAEPVQQTKPAGLRRGDSSLTLRVHITMEAATWRPRAWTIEPLSAKLSAETVAFFCSHVSLRFGLHRQRKDQ